MLDSVSMRLPCTMLLVAALGCGPVAAPADSAGTTSTASTGDPGTSTLAPTAGTTIATGDPGEGCDVWRQDCPEGQKCVPWPLDGADARSTARCVPLAGETVDGSCITRPWLDGDPEAIDNCVEGALCWPYAYGTVAPYVCISQCRGGPDAPECPEGRACNVRDGQLALCEVVDCDPLVPLCLDGRVCGFDGIDAFHCQPAGPSPSGLEGCELPSDCSPGLLCAPAERAPGWCEPGHARCCLEACDLDIGVCGIQGFTCAPFFAPGEAPPQYATVGVCGAL